MLLGFFTDDRLTDDDIKDLCFKALKEIIKAPGLKGVVLRSRIWKVISQAQVLYLSLLYVKSKAIIWGSDKPSV